MSRFRISQYGQAVPTGSEKSEKETRMAGPIVNAPIIMEIGKTKKKDIRDVARGQGKIMSDLQEAMAEVTSELGEQADGKQLVPVVLVYKKKKRSKRRGGLRLPVLF
ncbi:MAG TPA: hypothetical protein VHW00_05805 [Thermoanaerobaculia bacterium]|nr:hypothetical protein [Thermoanaerobaculia bacterium]